MKSLFAIVFATFYGFIFRLFFGYLGDYMEVMSISFLCILPFLIGYLTVILQPNEKEITSSSAFFLPWLSSLVILFITILLSIEGTICWIMIYPFFAVLAGIGGLIANHFRNKNKQKSRTTEHDPYILDQNDWDKPTQLTFGALLLLPMVCGLLEGDRTTSRQDYTETETVIINAPAEKIWQTLGSIDKVDSKDKPTYLTNMMGFPKHKETTLDSFALGGKRTAYYERDFYFDEIITEFDKNRVLGLEVNIDPTRIPADALDEHIVIGGKHLDILEDVYHLYPQPDGTTRVQLSSHFFINTPFNWYAGIWAKCIMSDLLHGELILIKKRAEM